MGREVKRVKMGFDWPLKKVWHGYLSWFRPPRCEPCDGSGLNPAAAGRRDELYAARDFDWHERIDGEFPDRSWACEWCGGRGSHRPADPGVLAALAPWAGEDGYYSFPKTEPPAGEGWQVWETTSEGSPVTPVFATPEELARHCADRGVSTFGDVTADYETWLRFVTGPGWAPSAVMGAGGLKSGVESFGQSGGA